MKFSIKWLLILVAAACITAHSLANASLFWGSLCFSIALLILGVGILGVMFCKENERAYWIGFCFMGICYFVLLFAPGPDRCVGHRLVTTKALGYLEPLIRRTDVATGDHVVNAARMATDAELEWTLNLGGNSNFLCPQWGHFQMAGHAAVALVLAVFGGTVARRFYDHERAEARTPIP